MGVIQLDHAAATAVAIEALGLDPQAVDFDAPEALAATLRRTASFMCPTTTGRLIRAVVDSLAGLRVIDADLRETLDELVASLIAYGDLLELEAYAEASGTGSRLYLGPPAFVARESGTVLLVGIRPEGEPLVSEELGAFVSNERHIRALPAGAVDDPAGVLASYGLTQTTLEHWHRAPAMCQPEVLVRGYQNRLDQQRSSGSVDGLTVLDGEQDVSYYRGRWRSPKHRDSGFYVARRARAFGAPLWCVVDLAEGEPVRLLDLPILQGLNRGCDEAWRLQAAIDADRGAPQIIRTDTPSGADVSVVDFTAPLPSWLQRRWDLVATPLVRRRGALLSYRIPTVELDEELAFVKERMWAAVEPTR